MLTSLFIRFFSHKQVSQTRTGILQVLTVAVLCKCLDMAKADDDHVSMRLTAMALINALVMRRGDLITRMRARHELMSTSIEPLLHELLASPHEEVAHQAQLFLEEMERDEQEAAEQGFVGFFEAEQVVKAIEHFTPTDKKHTMLAMLQRLLLITAEGTATEHNVWTDLETVVTKVDHRGETHRTTNLHAPLSPLSPRRQNYLATPHLHL